MAYLSQFDPPLLESKNGTLRWRFEMGLTLQGRQPPTNKAVSRLLTAYLIVVDKAIREYSTGCIKITENMNSGHIRPFVEDTGHLETCINSVKRAMRLLNRMGNAYEGIATDRVLRRRITAWEVQLTEVRDAVEHIDADILSEEGIDEGMAHLLTIADDGQRLEIANHSLSFQALYSTICSLYEAGEAMIRSLPSPAPD